MALPLLGLAGIAGKAALKKIAKTMAKRKAKKQTTLTPSKTKKNPTGKKNPTEKDIKKAKDFKNSPEYDKAVKKLEQEMVANTRKLGMTKKNPKASGEMFKTPKVSGGLTKNKPGVSGGLTKNKPGVSGGIVKEIKPGVSGGLTKKKPNLDKDKGVIRGKNPEGSKGIRNRNRRSSGESDTLSLSDEFNVDDYRKGGRVKKMAYGGKVKKTGARRGDGCAVRGKTRGRMI